MGEETQLATQPAKSPVLAGERGVRFSDMNDMWKFCCHVVNSAQFKDIPSPEVALIRLQAGLELGLTPIWSLTNIMVTNGRPSVWGDALLGLVLAHPKCVDVIETVENEGTEKEAAVCEVRREGREPIVRRFSIADTKQAGLTGKGVHGPYPKRMRQMRARAFACRDAFADALRGLCVREELEGVTHEPREVRGRVVETKLILPGEAEESPVSGLGVERADTNASEPSVEAHSGDDAPQRAPSQLDNSLPDLF